MNYKEFKPITAGIRNTIQVAELQDQLQNPALSQTERIRLTAEIVSVVTGGAYNPADESYDITNKHANELIKAFLGV